MILHVKHAICVRYIINTSFLKSSFVKLFVNLES